MSNPKTPSKITHDFPPFFRIHDTGQIERYFKHNFIPPSHDSRTNVTSKDIIISSQVSARIYFPNPIKNDPLKTKLPLIIYVHGGAFCVQSAFSSLYHNYINTMSSKSRSVVVSIEYRLVPEHPLPACYDDAWEVLKWVGSHSRVGSKPDPVPDPWLSGHVDFKRVFLVGDSAGANIAHNMVVRAGDGSGFGFRIVGLVLIHPYFGIGGKKMDEIWRFIYPDTTGSSDVWYDPGADMSLLSGLGCGRVLVCVAENDILRKRGLYYVEKLRESGWKGEIELFETVGGHVFHLFDPGCENARVLLGRVVRFIMGDGDQVVSRL